MNQKELDRLNEIEAAAKAIYHELTTHLKCNSSTFDNLGKALRPLKPDLPQVIYTDKSLREVSVNEKVLNTTEPRIWLNITKEVPVTQHMARTAMSYWMQSDKDLRACIGELFNVMLAAIRNEKTNRR